MGVSDISFEVHAGEIRGLFAVGTDACDIYNGTYYYYFPGNTMGFAVNSGRIAGENAAEYIEDMQE